MRFLFRPVDRWRVSQGFGDKGVCRKGSSVVSSHLGVCPAGYTSLYPSGGHTGLDIPCYRWQPVYAAQEGIVEEVQTEAERGLGIGIITTRKHHCDETGELEHMKHRYWHFIALDVHKGEYVTTGQFIGYADSTGFSTNDHLHFELKPVRKDSQGRWYNVLQENGTFGAIDPTPYLYDVFAPTVRTALQKLTEGAAQLLDSWQITSDTRRHLIVIFKYGNTFHQAF